MHGLCDRGALPPGREARRRRDREHRDRRGVVGRRRAGRRPARRPRRCRRRSGADRVRSVGGVPRLADAHHHGRGPARARRDGAAALAGRRRGQRDREDVGGAGRRPPPARGVGRPARQAAPAPVIGDDRARQDLGRRVGRHLPGVVLTDVRGHVPAGERRRRRVGARGRGRDRGLDRDRGRRRPMARPAPAGDRLGARHPAGRGRCGPSDRRGGGQGQRRRRRAAVAGGPRLVVRRRHLHAGSPTRPRSATARGRWRGATRSTSTCLSTIWSSCTQALALAAVDYCGVAE